MMLTHLVPKFVVGQWFVVAGHHRTAVHAGAVGPPVAWGVLVGFIAVYLLGSLSGFPQWLLDL